MKWIIIITGVLFVITKVVVIAQNTEEDADNNIDLDMKCIPKLADLCFADTYTNLECQLNPKSSSNCENKDVADLCSAINDGLKCASDIIDGDCTAGDGRNKFDAWLSGLKGVNSTLCSGKEPLMKVLWQNAQCWNILEFITCVERKIQISHIVHLLKVDLDMQTCFSFLVATTTCNVLVTKQNTDCLKPQDVINEAIHSFFSQTGCGTSCFTSSTTRNNITFTQSFTSLFLMLYLIFL